MKRLSLIVASFVVWASFNLHAHELNETVAKPVFYILVILGNQTAIQFTDKEACNIAADKLNSSVSWSYKSVCIEVK